MSSSLSQPPTTALNLNNGAQTANAPVLQVGQTWNNAAAAFTAAKINVADTASGAASRLLDLMVGGVSRVYVEKTGQVYGTSANGLRPLHDHIGNVAFTSHALADWGASKWSLFTGSFGGGSYCFQLASDFGMQWRSGSTSASGVADLGLSRASAGVLEFTNGTPGTLRDWKARRGTLTEYLDVVESAAPAAPAANTARLYAEDDGAGKTRLMVLFPSGAAQQLAIEP